MVGNKVKTSTTPGVARSRGATAAKPVYHVNALLRYSRSQKKEHNNEVCGEGEEPTATVFDSVAKQGPEKKNPAVVNVLEACLRACH